MSIPYARILEHLSRHGEAADAWLLTDHPEAADIAHRIHKNYKIIPEPNVLLCALWKEKSLTLEGTELTANAQHLTKMIQYFFEVPPKYISRGTSAKVRSFISLSIEGGNLGNLRSECSKPLLK